MRYAYLDETSDESSYCGYGAYFTDLPVPNWLIEDAMQKLRMDSDPKSELELKLDTSTLTRKHFHACFDSKNGHSYISRAIDKFNSGELYSEFAFPKVLNSKNFVKHSVEDLFRKTSNLTLLRTFYNIEPISILFEQRSGLSIDSITESIKQLEQEALKSFYDLPQIPLVFPKWSVGIGTKEDPGLQFVDYLLWASKQYIVDKKPKYIRWLKIPIYGETKPEDGSYTTFHADFSRSGLQDSSIYDNFRPSTHISNSITNIDIIKMFISSVRIIRYFHDNPLTGNLAHNNLEIQNIKHKLLSLDTISIPQRIIEMFLRLFDSVPLLTNISSESEFIDFLNAKKFLALSLNRQFIHGIRTYQLIHRYWYSLDDQEKQALWASAA